ncbi:MAG: DNA alkylation repair protein [bacterium]|nr:DNA alkylation repair protein [bacterium]
MQLNLAHWTKEDGQKFQEYLKTFSKGPEKSAWEKRIINTPMACIAVPSPQVKKITQEIAKGNFLEFLDLNLWENFTNTSINGGLIVRIKDFSLMEKYLVAFLEKADNWATVDCLKLPVKNSNKEQFFTLAKKLVKSKKPFVRRGGVTILFKFVDDDRYLPQIFQILNSFIDEKEYYVNMVNAWLVAECFTKQRAATLAFLQTHRLNKFTINRAVQKCRDSYRIAAADKEMLLKFKQ